MDNQTKNILKLIKERADKLSLEAQGLKAFMEGLLYESPQQVEELESRKRAEELLKRARLENEKAKHKQEDELLLKLSAENKKPLSPIFEDLTPERFILKQKNRRKKQ